MANQTFDENNMAELMELIHVAAPKDDTDDRFSISPEEAAKNFMRTHNKKVHETRHYRPATLKFCARMDDETRDVLLQISRHK